MKKISFCMLAACLLMMACNNASTNESGVSSDAATTAESKEERNKKVVMTSLESFMKGDMDGTFKDVAPNFTDYADGSIPPMTNLDSLKAFLKMMTTSIEGYRGENLRYYTDGDYVLVHGDWKGTFKNDLMGIKATGKAVSFKDVDIFKFNEDGKVTEHHSIQNVPAILMASSMQQ